MAVANDLPDSLFANPVWHALRTKHRHFALFAGNACRYPADVAPFAAVVAPTAAALNQLRSLLAAGESVWVIGDTYPAVPGLGVERRMECFQMFLPANVTPDGPTCDIVRLSDANAPEMVALTATAFPGFFRSRTCEMGSYRGVRSNGELIAMGGERLMLDSYPEISGVCTHPAHRRKGLAASIVWQIARDHRRDGLVSWLHVASDNHKAIRLYLRMGFKRSRRVMLNRLSRRD